MDEAHLGAYIGSDKNAQVIPKKKRQNRWNFVFKRLLRFMMVMSPPPTAFVMWSTSKLSIIMIQNEKRNGSLSGMVWDTTSTISISWWDPPKIPQDIYKNVCTDTYRESRFTCCAHPLWFFRIYNQLLLFIKKD